MEETWHPYTCRLQRHDISAPTCDASSIIYIQYKNNEPERRKDVLAAYYNWVFSLFNLLLGMFELQMPIETQLKQTRHFALFVSPSPWQKETKQITI